MVFTVLGFIIGLAVSIVTGSSATLGYALENAVDSFSSGLVLWRFWGGGKAGSPSEEELELREKRSSIGIAIAFMVLGFVVGGVASSHLAHETEPDKLTALLSLSIPSVPIFGVLGLAKLYVGTKIDSPSLKKDGICSVCGSGLSLGVSIGGLLLLGGADAWWLDGTIAVLVSLGLFGYGFYTLHKAFEEGNKWWTAAFWSTPKSRLEAKPIGNEMHDLASDVEDNQL